MTRSLELTVQKANTFIYRVIIISESSLYNVQNVDKSTKGERARTLGGSALHVPTDFTRLTTICVYRLQAHLYCGLFAQKTTENASLRATFQSANAPRRLAAKADDNHFFVLFGNSVPVFYEGFPEEPFLKWKTCR